MICDIWKASKDTIDAISFSCYHNSAVLANCASANKESACSSGGPSRGHCITQHENADRILMQRWALGFQKASQSTLLRHRNYDATTTLQSWQIAPQLREAPVWKMPGLFGHCPNGVGGSRPLPKWFGALILRRIVHVQRGICLVWGAEPLPGWFGALMQWKLKFKWHLLKSVRK